MTNLPADPKPGPSEFHLRGGAVAMQLDLAFNRTHFTRPCPSSRGGQAER
jgi:hypothetical protein